MRDRLIEIVERSFEMQYAKRGLLTANHTVDDILANGVIVPPVEIDGIFWGIQGNNCFAYSVNGFKWGLERGTGRTVLYVLTVYEMEFIWGEEAFATEEEAERVLKGENNG